MVSFPNLSPSLLGGNHVLSKRSFFRRPAKERLQKENEFFDLPFFHCGEKQESPAHRLYLGSWQLSHTTVKYLCIW